MPIKEKVSKHRYSHKGNQSFWCNLKKRDEFIKKSHPNTFFMIKIEPKNQLLALCFLTLIASAYAIDHIPKFKEKPDPKKLPSHKPPGNAELKALSIREACTRVSPTSNKPTELTLGINHLGALIPFSCEAGRNDACKSESIILADFKQRVDEVTTMRQNMDTIFSKWKESFKPRVKELSEQLPAQEKGEFLKNMQLILHLKQDYLLASQAKKTDAGNCAEHSRVALISLLQAKQKLHFSLKIQLITLTAPGQDGHTFLLLDSNMPEGKIENDKTSFNKFWEFFDGTICDPWNHGTLVSSHDKTSKLYGPQSHWNSIDIENYELNLQNFMRLPLTHQLFICQHLNKMNLDLDSEATCQQIMALK